MRSAGWLSPGCPASRRGNHHGSCGVHVGTSGRRDTDSGQAPVSRVVYRHGAAHPDQRAGAFPELRMGNGEPDGISIGLQFDDHDLVLASLA